MELTKDELFDIARQFKPALERAEFERDWDEFQILKAARLAKLKIQ